MRVGECKCSHVGHPCAADRPTRMGRFRTNRELPRQVRQLAGPDKSELQGPQPAERRSQRGTGFRSSASGEVGGAHCGVDGV